MTSTTPAKTTKESQWFSNSVYDFLKQLAQYWFPAAGTAYATIAALWGLPFAVQIVGTLAALDVLLGVILGISTAVYTSSGAAYDGSLVVDSSGPTDTHSLEFNAPLTTLAQQSAITLKVTQAPVATTPAPSADPSTPSVTPPSQ
jgi:hypothetical protein